MAEIDDFHIGDVVKLRSSVTRMTVCKIDHAAGTIVAHWFNDANELQEFPFSPAQLVILKPATEV